jgi:hypothetical protein
MQRLLQRPIVPFRVTCCLPRPWQRYGSRRYGRAVEYDHLDGGHAVAQGPFTVRRYDTVERELTARIRRRNELGSQVMGELVSALPRMKAAPFLHFGDLNSNRCPCRPGKTHY